VVCSHSKAEAHQDGRETAEGRRRSGLEALGRAKKDLELWRTRSQTRAMYELKVLGLQLLIAADDLAIPAALALLVRVFWTVILAGFLVVVSRSELEVCIEGVPGAGNIIPLAWVLLGFVAAQAAVFFGMYGNAMKGGLMEPEKREGIKIYVYAIVSIYIAELGMAVFGVITLLERPEAPIVECEKYIKQAWALGVFGTVAVFLDVSLFVLFTWAVVTRNKRKIKVEDGVTLDEFEMSAMGWAARCRQWCSVLYCLSCAGCYGDNVNEGNEADYAFTQVGQVLASWFTGLKLSPTDLLAGLCLLRAEQIRKRQDTFASQLSIRVDSDDMEYKLGQKYPTGKIKVKPKFERFPSATHDDEIGPAIRDLHMVMKYSEAMNLWKLYLMNAWLQGKTASAITKLIRRSFSQARSRSRNGEFNSGDNCCAWGHTAFVEAAGIAPEDLVFSKFVSYAHELVAFAVAVDHKQKKVVLVFRGSLALADLITDAAIHPTHLHRIGEKYGFDGSKAYAHGGMLASAVKVVESLDETGILRRLFRQNHGNPTKPDETSFQHVANEKLPDCQGYELVILGESLGAGIAAIVSLLLRQQYSDLKGFGFSTPGCIFSKELAEDVGEFFTSVFVGKDLVPRANWQSLETLRSEVLDVLRRSRVNKNIALRSLFKKNPPETLTFRPEEVIPYNGNLQQIDEMIQNAEALKTREGSSRRLVDVPTYCAGRIIHLSKTQTINAPGLCCCCSSTHRSYEAHWIKDRTDMSYFEISSRMALDHMPDQVHKALDDCIDFI